MIQKSPRWEQSDANDNGDGQLLKDDNEVRQWQTGDYNVGR
jgi:hypothetical protein